jgi:hypothetical protein
MDHIDDADLVALVRERSGARLITPKDKGKVRALTEAEREVLERFVRLGYPYPERAARAVLRDALTLFEIEEPKPQPEHMTGEPPPAVKVEE